MVGCVSYPVMLRNSGVEDSNIIAASEVSKLLWTALYSESRVRMLETWKRRQEGITEKITKRHAMGRRSRVSWAFWNTILFHGENLWHDCDNLTLKSWISFVLTNCFRPPGRTIDQKPWVVRNLQVYVPFTNNKDGRLAWRGLFRQPRSSRQSNSRKLASRIRCPRNKHVLRRFHARWQKEMPKDWLYRGLKSWTE